MFLRFARRTKVDALQKGSEAVVEGKIVALSSLKLPQSGTTCVWCEVVKEVYKRGARGAGRKLWFPESVEQKLEPFYLEDETGRVLVSAPGEEVSVTGALVEADRLGQKGTRRYSARYVQEGFVVRVRGLVDEPRRGEPRKGLVLRPGRKGRLELLVRKTTS